MRFNFTEIYKKQLEIFFEEDDLHKNAAYIHSLPKDKVLCKIKIKDNMILSGLPFFFEVFNYLSDEKIDYSEFLKFEGKEYLKSDLSEIHFELPFNIALTGERIALNLLQRSSSISTYTNQFVKKASGVKVLDTRKTTPGLRFLEKYAVRQGGGFNHRFGQMDAWMIKDNHKKIFGGVDKAIEYFQNLNTFYQPIIVEIHDLDELKVCFDLGMTHFLLDNFSPSDIKKAVEVKKPGVTYEVSGGITIDSIESYCISGVDAISSGSITYNAPHVDLSLKFERL